MKAQRRITVADLQRAVDEVAPQLGVADFKEKIAGIVGPSREPRPPIYRSKKGMRDLARLNREARGQ